MNRNATKDEFKTKEEKCAKEIIEWMLKHHLWMDTCIYVNGKRYGCYNGEHHIYDNTWDCVFVEDDMDPQDYFEFIGDGKLCMSFEGPLYDILNYYNDFAEDYDDRMNQEFSAILAKYGRFFELGDAWNLCTCKM